MTKRQGPGIDAILARSLGHFDRTEIPCPACEREGRQTQGGYTPRLVRGSDGRLRCMSTHDYGHGYPEGGPCVACGGRVRNPARYGDVCEGCTEAAIADAVADGSLA